MGLTEIEKLKVQKLAKEKQVKSFNSDNRKHNGNAKFDNARTHNQDNSKAVDYYDSLSDSEKAVFNKELEKKKIRDSYVRYLKYIYGENYKLTKFHLLLATIAENVVKRIEKGEKVYICISTPPQHGKSTCLTQTLPSWFLGRNPDLRCITTAYNADIAEKFGDEPRQQIKKYGKDLFGIEISDSQDNKTLWNIKNHMGGMYSTGINGSLTSNQGALIIVDDPIKNEIEANNPTIREQIWANFSTSLWTRQRGAGCGIIVIQTRWHEDDLIGRILANDSDSQWVYINIPCVWESGIDKLLKRKIGETLCPELGFDAKWADNTRKMLGVRRFNALYQGKPIVDGGNIVKREWIKLYNKQSMPNAFDELTLSCDLSFGGKKTDNDPNGIGVWGRVGANHYLLEVVNKKCGFTDILERIRYLCGKYPQMKRKIVESKASGSALIDTLNREIGGFIGYDPKMLSKEDRLKLSLPLFESGNVYFPDEDIDKDSEEYITQLVRFPKYTHDEIVDITTQYLLNYEYKYGGKIGTDNKYATLSKAIRGFRI